MVGTYESGFVTKLHGSTTLASPGIILAMIVQILFRHAICIIYVTYHRDQKAFAWFSLGKPPKSYFSSGPATKALTPPPFELSGHTYFF